MAQKKIYYLRCPYCRDLIPLPDDCIGQDREDPSNVVGCLSCNANSDYDDDEVRTMTLAVLKIQCKR